MEEKKSSINVLYATDNNYVDLMMISICSLLENNKEIFDINFYIIGISLSKNDKEKISGLINNYNRCVYYIDDFDFAKYRIPKEKAAMLSRLFISELINVDRIIYLDCDVIVKENIKELFDIDMQEKVIAGVRDTVNGFVREKNRTIDKNIYINSGVLVFDLCNWKKNDIDKKIINLIEQEGANLKFPDQDIINRVVEDKITILHPKYNVMNDFIVYSSSVIKKMAHLKEFYSDKELAEARDNPSIIHYAGNAYHRPWCTNCDHRYKNEFFKYENKCGVKLQRINGKVSRAGKIKKLCEKGILLQLLILMIKVFSLVCRICGQKQD